MLLAACTASEEKTSGTTTPVTRPDTDSCPDPGINEPGEVCETDALTACISACGTVCGNDNACREPCFASCAKESSGDVTPPVTLVVGPESPVLSDTATLSFACNEESCTFQCRLNGEPWRNCVSPETLSGLGEGEQVFEVLAVDAAGNQEVAPARFAWVVTAGPGNGTPAGADSPVSDSGQLLCYDHASEIPCPAPGEAFFGQDGHYYGTPMSHSVVGDGTVLDEVTGLQWQREGDGVVRTWLGALSYCGSLELAGYSDWRLPGEWELITLVDFGKVSPAIDTTAFPDTRSSLYWTSTEHAGSAEMAWSVLFSYGYVAPNPKTHDNAFVRCVR